MVSSVNFRFPVFPKTAQSQENIFLRNRAIADKMKGLPPSWKGTAMPMADIAADGLQMARNVANLTPQIGSDNRIVGNLGFLSGSIWLMLGIDELANGAQDYSEATAIRDGEGTRRAKARLFSGTLLTGGSIAYLAGKTVEFAGASEVAAAGLGFAADGIFGVGSIFGMGMSCLGMYRCYRFRARLAERLEDPKIQSEALRCLRALEYLKDAMTVTDEDRAKIVEEADALDLSPKDRQAYIDQKLLDRTEVKMKYLKRRTSQRSLRMILNRIEPIMGKLANPTLEAEGIAEAKALIADVTKESRKKSLLYAIAFIASAIGFAALVIGTFFTAGALPLILYIISSAIYIGMAGYAFYQKMNAKQPEISGANLPPLSAS
jgi:hypothetical protein